MEKNVIKTDVLVLGGGMAGLFAALRAKERGADVLVVEENVSGFSGQSVGGTHRMRAVFPEDDFDAFFEGTVKETEYMIDQDFCEKALKETLPRIRELEEMGVRFRKGDDGQIRWYWADTLDPNFKQRNVAWEPMGSYRHVLRVKREAESKGIRIMDRIMISDLLTSDGAVCGAVGFQTRTGEFYVFESKAVVLATGTFSGAAVTNPNLSGDGTAMAFRVGAELRNMEFGRSETGGLPPKAGGSAWVARLLNPQEQEIKLTNSLGEEFMEKYELGKRVPGRKPYGPPWRVQLMAMYEEMKAGKGPCYVDYRCDDKTGRMREFWGSFYDRMAFQQELAGAPLNEAVYELGLARGFSFGGGVRINPDSETTVKGLYAAGATSDSNCCVQYSILSGIMTAIITGGKAGEKAAEFIKTASPVVCEEQVKVLKEKTYAPLYNPPGVTEEVIREKTTAAWLNIDLRTEERLKKAVDDIRDLQAQARNICAKDYHELAKALKMQNYLVCSEAVAVAALNRRETRLEHIRQDYPVTDNKNWLKWVVICKNESGNAEARLEEIPLARWRFKPQQEYVDRLELRKED